VLETQLLPDRAPPNGFFAHTHFDTFLSLMVEGTHVDDPKPMPLGWPMP
jgi:hypothetical protein